MPRDLDADWNNLHDAKPDGWFVGRMPGGALDCWPTGMSDTLNLLSNGQRNPAGAHPDRARMR